MGGSEEAGTHTAGSVRPDRVALRRPGDTGIVGHVDDPCWTLELPGLLLPGPNRLLRMNRHDYRRFRDELLMRARGGLSAPAPKAPLRHCVVAVHLTRPGRSLLDADAKYGAVKPLLDVLQPHRNYGRTLGARRILDAASGLGLIADDRDGEGELAGCIRRLMVTQSVGDAHVRVEVRAQRSA